MKWHKEHILGSAFEIYYPCFEADEYAGEGQRAKNKRMRDNTERMNKFYLELSRCATEFSQTLGAGSRYFADCSAVSDDDGSITVEVTLRLRHRGRTVARKGLRHRWLDGVILTDGKVRHGAR